MPSFNSNTLNPEEQIEASGEMRRKKRSSDSDKDGEGKSAEQSKSYQQTMAQARKWLSEQKKLRERVAKKITSPVREGTSWLLRGAWGTAETVLGFLLIGLPWINIHWFLNKVFGDKLFCTLGHEWIPEKVKANAGGEGAPAGEAMEQGEKMIGWLEVFVLLFLDVLVVFIILGVLTLLCIIIDVYLHPVSTIWNLITDFIFNKLKALF